MSDKVKRLIVLPDEVYKQFQSKYPRLFTVFVRRCLIKAFNDREFFENVFFGTSDKWSQLGSYRPEYVVDDD